MCASGVVAAPGGCGLGHCWRTRKQAGVRGSRALCDVALSGGKLRASLSLW